MGADVVSDDCGCKKYVCKKRPCAPLPKDMIKCDDNKHKKQPTIGLDACKCQVQTCVDKEKVCEDLLRTTLRPTRPPTTVDPNPFGSEFGQLIYRVQSKSGVNAYRGFMDQSNVKTGGDYSNLLAPLNGAWADKKFLQNWEQHMKPDTKIRFVFWKLVSKQLQPVVDYVFKGLSSNKQHFFTRERLLTVNAGPNARGGPFNFFSAKGQTDNGRHFFINKSYNGCDRDVGMVVVSDKGEPCTRYWDGGKGWDAFPRFLYSGDVNGCTWADPNCAQEADMMTISVIN